MNGCNGKVGVGDRFCVRSWKGGDCGGVGSGRNDLPEGEATTAGVVGDVVIVGVVVGKLETTYPVRFIDTFSGTFATCGAHNEFAPGFDGVVVPNPGVEVCEMKGAVLGNGGRGLILERMRMRTSLNLRSFVWLR